MTITSFILDYATKSPQILHSPQKLKWNISKNIPPPKKNLLHEKLQGTSQDISVCIG